MKLSPKTAVILVLSGVFFLTACAREETDAGQNAAKSVNNNSATAKDDVLELEKLVNLPFTPGESTVWRETDAKPGDAAANSQAAGGKMLVAVLQFESKQIEEIIARAEAFGPVTPGEIYAENWFPAELIAQSQMSGNGTLKGNSFAANEFAKAPFIDGKLTRIINTDFFVLELTSQ